MADRFFRLGQVAYTAKERQRITEPVVAMREHGDTFDINVPALGKFTLCRTEPFAGKRPVVAPRKLIDVIDASDEIERAFGRRHNPELLGKLLRFHERREGEKVGGREVYVSLKKSLVFPPCADGRERIVVFESILHGERSPGQINGRGLRDIIADGMLLAVEEAIDVSTSPDPLLKIVLGSNPGKVMSQIHGGPVAHIAQLDPPTGLVQTAGIIVRTSDVFYIAVLGSIPRGNSERQPVFDNREVEGRLEVIEITTTEVGADIAFKLIARFLADDVDGAANGVLAEQRALGPA